MYFASGPTSKPKGWDVKRLSAFTSRYHRSAKVKQALKQAHNRLKALLQLPKGYELYFTPAGASGAFECGLWNLLGQRAAVLEFDKFSCLWLKDCQRLATHTETFTAPLGKIPPLGGIAPLRLKGFDVVFVYVATTTGVVIPNEDWLMPPASKNPSEELSSSPPSEPPHTLPHTASAHLLEESLVFADVTAAVFTHPIGWHNLDVAAFSLAKAITGEAGFGALVLSTKAQSRLAKQARDPVAIPPAPTTASHPAIPSATTAPLARPIPHIFTIPQNGWEPINTFSALAIADLLMALDWLEGIGGQPASIEKARTNRLRLAKWAEQTHWLEELAASKETRANCPATYRFVAQKSPEPPTKGAEQEEQEERQEQEKQKEELKEQENQKAQETQTQQEPHPKEPQLSRMLNLLEKQYGICDISSHPSAPLGLRIWCGANIEPDAISTLTKHLEQAYRITK